MSVCICADMSGAGIRHDSDDSLSLALASIHTVTPIAKSGFVRQL